MALSIGYANHATEVRVKARQIEAQQLKAAERKEALQSAQEALESLEKEKTDTEAQLQKKELREAELKREIEDLKKQVRIKKQRALAAAQERQRTRARSMGATIRPNYQVIGELMGSRGYVRSWGNCVNTARAHGKVQPGNPITWRISTRKPFIGAAALFHYNHVAIISGIWSNGDIEVMHENFKGMRTRFSQSEIRGYF